MKKAIILCTPLNCIIFLLFANLGFVSCREKDNPSDENFRLTERKIYQGGLLDTRLVFEYEADKLILQKNYSYGDDTETARRVFVYYEDSVVVTGHVCFDGEWSLFSKYVYEFEGKKMLKTSISTYQDSVWELHGKMEFLYSGDNLINESWSSYDHGNWIEITRNTFEYNGGSIVISRSYVLESGEMKYIMKEVADYNGNKINTVTKYFLPGDTLNGSFRYDFSYDGNLLIRVGFFDNDSGWIPAGGKDFIYNADGILSKQITTNNDGINEEEYTYEPGKGNYEQFIHPGFGIISEYNYPHPTRQLDSWTVGQLDSWTVGL